MPSRYLLCEARLYTGLDSGQVCKIRGLLSKQTFGARQVVFRQDDASDWLYVIRSGQIKLTSCDPDGREQIICIGVAGHMVGFNTVDDHHHGYSAETLTPVRVCTIRHRDMLGLTVETVSRLRSELKRERIIEAPRGHLRILNLKGLRAYACTAFAQWTGRLAWMPA